jgi:hypothetical protein
MSDSQQCVILYFRWDALRATEGWAALQHHSVLRTTLTLHPPATPCDSSTPPIRLSVHLRQGTFFAILPASWHNQRAHIVPQWHAGNIYAMPNTIPATVDLPISPSMHTSTEYDIFVSGDYEVRNLTAMLQTFTTATSDTTVR